MIEPRVLVLISADSEWRACLDILTPAAVKSSSMGDYFHADESSFSPTFFHGGWGKISAAATTQFVIDSFHPGTLVNLGTCGGFSGHIDRGVVILVERTIVYDIIEQMSDPEEAIAHYSSALDLSRLPDPLPYPVQRGLLVSADRDILPADIPFLSQKYRAVAADWESGAIAWVAKRNSIPLLMLRGVTDLVTTQGGEAYGDIQLFHANTHAIMDKLIGQLPAWLEAFCR